MDKSQILINSIFMIFFITYIYVLDQMKNENLVLVGNFYRRSFVSNEWKLEYLSLENEKHFIWFIQNNRFKVSLMITIFVGIIIQTLIVSLLKFKINFHI